MRTLASIELNTEGKFLSRVLAGLLVAGSLGQSAHGANADDFINSHTFNETPLNVPEYGTVIVTKINGGWTIQNSDVIYRFSHGVSFNQLPPWVKETINVQSVPIGSGSLGAGHKLEVSSITSPNTVSYPWDGTYGLFTYPLDSWAHPAHLCQDEQQRLIQQEGQTEEQTLTEGFTVDRSPTTAIYMVKFENPLNHGETLTFYRQVGVDLKVRCQGPNVSEVEPPPLNLPPAGSLATAEQFQLVDADLTLSWEDPAQATAGDCPAILEVEARVRSNLAGPFKAWVDVTGVDGFKLNSKPITLDTDTPVQGGLVKKDFNDTLEMPLTGLGTSGEEGPGGAQVFGGGVTQLQAGSGDDGGFNPSQDLEAENNQPDENYKVWVRVHAATLDGPNEADGPIGGLADVVQQNKDHVVSEWKTASITCKPVVAIDTPGATISFGSKAKLLKSNDVAEPEGQAGVAVAPRTQSPVLLAPRGVLRRQDNHIQLTHAADPKGYKIDWQCRNKRTSEGNCHTEGLPRRLNRENVSFRLDDDIGPSNWTVEICSISDNHLCARGSFQYEPPQSGELTAGRTAPVPKGQGSGSGLPTGRRTNTEQSEDRVADVEADVLIRKAEKVTSRNLVVVWIHNQGEATADSCVVTAKGLTEGNQASSEPKDVRSGQTRKIPIEMNSVRKISRFKVNVDCRNDSNTGNNSENL